MSSYERMGREVLWPEPRRSRDDNEMELGDIRPGKSVARKPVRERVERPT